MLRRNATISQNATVPVTVKQKSSAGQDRITISREAQSGDWMLEMSDGLDLLEVARVVGVIQNHAIELMQRQVSPDARPPEPAPAKADQSITDTVEF